MTEEFANGAEGKRSVNIMSAAGVTNLYILYAMFVEPMGKIMIVRVVRGSE